MRLSGSIDHPDENLTLTLYRGTTLLHTFTVESDGTFDDRFAVEEGIAFIVYGSNFKRIYVKNGFESTFKFDNDSFNTSAKLLGDAADIYALEATFDSLEADFSDRITDHPTIEYFEHASTLYRTEFLELLNANSITDEAQVHTLLADVDDFISRFRVKIERRVQVKQALKRGDPSPTFEDYENVAGGFSSLSDFKGKYVYIDFWTTWCGPCLKEFPALKELESNYANSTITFLYLSLDAPEVHQNDPEKARTAWRNYVKEHELGGVHLFTDNDFKSDFVKDYNIDFIPRYVLIDPNGNIVDPDAPRPSSPLLIELFNELGISPSNNKS